MKNLLLGVAAAASLLGATAAAGAAQAQDAPRLIFGVDRPGDMPTFDKVQFIYLGRNYCWYDSGWRGPGFYWCGFAWRQGLGWGGGWGWRGWYGHRGWNGWNGGPGPWRGAQGYGHGGYAHGGYAHGAYRGGARGAYGPRGANAARGGGRPAHAAARGGDHRPDHGR